jgi:phosphoribosylamine--glycine ligase
MQELVDTYGDNADFLIEECLMGREISILAFTDGKNYQLLLPSQDHKQLLAGDKGYNTGGMGAYCPVPFYDEKMKKQIIKEIIDPTMNGIQKENFNYKGVIYFGIMLTETGPKLLEYNVRLGDPETEVVLPALKSDLAELLLSCFNGNLKDFKLEFNSGFFIDVVLVSGGYPKKYQTNYVISGIDDLDKDTLCFVAGAKKIHADLVTSGGRVLNIVVHADTLEKAIGKVYSEVKKIDFKDCYYRTDIGKRELR